MLSREEGREGSIPYDSTEGLLRRYALQRSHLLLLESHDQKGSRISWERTSGALRCELAGRLSQEQLAIELDAAERYARDEAQLARGLLSRNARRAGKPVEAQEIAAGLTVAVNRAEAGCLRGLAHQLADARLQFRAATWRGDLRTALAAEQAWNCRAAEMTELLAALAGTPAADANGWLQKFRHAIDTDPDVDAEAASYQPRYSL